MAFDAATIVHVVSVWTRRDALLRVSVMRTPVMHAAADEGEREGQ